MAHRCIHGELKTAPLITQSITYDSSQSDARRLQSSAAYQPIRIAADFSGLSVTGEVGQYIRQELVPQALAYFQNLLRVVPVQSRLVLDSSVCNDARIPRNQSHAGFAADFILFVTSAATPDGVIAWATSCVVDQNGRPVAGQVNFGPSNIALTAADKQAQLVTAIHEMTHALVFDSANLLPNFRDENNVPRGLNNILTQVTRRGYTTYQIVTPTVQQVVRQQFNCESLGGADLEAQGGDGSRLAHWERRVFGSEYMTATNTPNPVFSMLTLALFQDSGWYQVDMTKAQPLAWGYGAGCGFVENSCVVNGVVQSPSVFCDAQSAQGCTPDRRFQATCSFAQYSSSLPDFYRHYPQAKVGGIDTFADYCAYFVPSPSSSCVDSSRAVDQAAGLLGVAYGTSSRCFQGTYSSTAAAFNNFVHSACHTTRCDGTSGQPVLTVTIGNTDVACPPAGGAVSVNGYNGQLFCPPASEVCPTVASSCQCSGHGSCGLVNNTCICQNGWSGSDCGTRSCPNQCSGHGRCNGNDGTCSCQTGWGGDSCEAVTGCPDGQIYTCDGVCVSDSTCSGSPGIGYSSCSNWFKDNTCDNGRYLSVNGISMNWNCPRFQCDSGACDVCGLDATQPDATYGQRSNGQVQRPSLLWAVLIGLSALFYLF
eukprot:GILK01011667.1.p1 GENE.GILK01011667.1~~GILK01011667.1.p1  ORF type:complete len:706 (+),score=76.99 GILK01011667.1:163-2118(+)